jgi:hypothetical protein
MANLLLGRSVRKGEVASGANLRAPTHFCTTPYTHTHTHTFLSSIGGFLGVTFVTLPEKTGHN